MYKIVATGKFKKDLKLIKKRVENRFFSKQLTIDERYFLKSG